MRGVFAIVFLLVSGICAAGVEDHLKPCLGKSDYVSAIPEVDFLYLINLDRRHDRLARSLEQLRPYGIVPYRFSAVEAKSLSVEALEDVGVQFQEGMRGGQWVTYYPTDKGGCVAYDFLRQSCYGKSYFSQWMSRGAIGCTLSHLSILQDALTSGYETIWILEDDFLVLKDPRTIYRHIDALDSLVGHGNWDVLFTDDCPIASGPKKLEKKDFWFLWRPDVMQYDYDSYAERTLISSDILKIGARIRTHSMIIRRSGMKKILDFETQNHLFLPYDNELILIPTLQQYALVHPFVTNRSDSSSDVQMTQQ
jgi:GR25 family glycosyltransferase involved in LPS biosynthesis